MYIRVWNFFLETWTSTLTPHTLQTFILIEWSSHQGCAVMTDPFNKQVILRLINLDSFNKCVELRLSYIVKYLWIGTTRTRHMNTNCHPIFIFNHFNKLYQNLCYYTERCYVYNIFTTNYMWLVVIGSNLKLTLRLPFCPNNNN